VLDFDAAVNHGNKPCIAGDLIAQRAGDAKLLPEHFGAERNRLPRDGRHIINTTKNINDVDRLINIG
jgi:hypothetical protein